MKIVRYLHFFILFSACFSAGVSQADTVQRRVAAGVNHSLTVKEDGTLWTWGDNAYGQLGIGSTVDQWFPARVGSLSNVVAAAGGIYHSVAAKADGTVWAWGYNYYGQLGDGTTTQRTIPVQVSGLSGVVAVAAGDSHSVALKGDGTVWAWGYNGYGQLGDGTTTQRTTPVQVSGLSGVIAIAAGGSFTLALKSDGTDRGDRKYVVPRQSSESLHKLPENILKTLVSQKTPQSLKKPIDNGLTPAWKPVQTFARSICQYSKSKKNFWLSYVSVHSIRRFFTRNGLSEWVSSMKSTLLKVR